MKMGNRKCNDCYWSDQCHSDEKCEYFTPIDSEEDDIAEYDRVICENTSEYEDLVREFDS